MQASTGFKPGDELVAERQGSYQLNLARHASTPTPELPPNAAAALSPPLSPAQKVVKQAANAARKAYKQQHKEAAAVQLAENAAALKQMLVEQLSVWVSWPAIPVAHSAVPTVRVWVGRDSC